MRHGTAAVDTDVRIHYLDSGAGERCAVLVHGFPQTAHEWRHVVPGLARAGFRVVAPDYRGAGASSKPAGGYDKVTMAGDLRALVRDHLGIEAPLTLVGHDIGAMVALAFALHHRDDVARLVLVDAPLPGTKAFEAMKGDPRGWHAAFHGARDVAELLVHGRERPYLQRLIGDRIFDPTAITPADLDEYVRAYEAPGALRAGFELYRAFEQDAADVRAALADGGPVDVPTLAVVGAAGGLAGVMEDMVREVAADVELVAVPDAAHWVPEEQPERLADLVVQHTT